MNAPYDYSRAGRGQEQHTQLTPRVCVGRRVRPTYEQFIVFEHHKAMCEKLGNTFLGVLFHVFKNYTKGACITVSGYILDILDMTDCNFSLFNFHEFL